MSNVANAKVMLTMDTSQFSAGVTKVERDLERMRSAIARSRSQDLKDLGFGRGASFESIRKGIGKELGGLGWGGAAEAQQQIVREMGHGVSASSMGMFTTSMRDVDAATKKAATSLDDYMIKGLKIGTAFRGLSAGLQGLNAALEENAHWWDAARSGMAALPFVGGTAREGWELGEKLAWRREPLLRRGGAHSRKEIEQMAANEAKTREESAILLEEERKRLAAAPGSAVAGLYRMADESRAAWKAMQPANPRRDEDELFRKNMGAISAANLKHYGAPGMEEAFNRASEMEKARHNETLLRLDDDAERVRLTNEEHRKEEDRRKDTVTTQLKSELLQKQLASEGRIQESQAEQLRQHYDELISITTDGEQKRLLAATRDVAIANLFRDSGDAASARSQFAAQVTAGFDVPKAGVMGGLPPNVVQQVQAPDVVQAIQQGVQQIVRAPGRMGK